MDLTVTSEVLAAMRDHARTARPEEACGILFGSAGAITGASLARNVHALPRTHFEIDPQALIDAHRRARGGAAAVAGYYHSHPNGLAEPSATDRARAAGGGMVWAIVTAAEVTFWRDDPGGFVPLSYTAGPA